MFSNILNWSTAAIGGTPFRLNKCTALSSVGKGAATGGVLGGAPGTGARRTHRAGRPGSVDHAPHPPGTQ